MQFHLNVLRPFRDADAADRAYTVDALGGTDVIWGGLGADRVDGGPGSDRVDCSAGTTWGSVVVPGGFGGGDALRGSGTLDGVDDGDSLTGAT